MVKKVVIASQPYTQLFLFKRGDRVSSLAQEESRSISENVTWGQRKRFADGKVCVPYSRFLGYDKGEDGNLSLNEDEAKTVRLIYKLFLEGYSFYSIAKKLTNLNIKSPGHKDKWNRSAVESILTNEKYKGDALLQKSYTVDFLTKKHKKNEGEIPQYYVEDNHTPIVSKEVFEMVQQEIKKRTKGGRRYSGVGIFGSKIKCMECGSWYGAKVWHSTDKYKKTIYRCNHKYGDKKVCETPHLNEEEIKEIAVIAINKVLRNKKEIIETIENVISKIGDVSNLNKKKIKYEQELKVITELTEEHINKNKTTLQNQKEYNDKYDELVRQYDETKSKYDLLVEEISIEMARRKSLEKYVSDLKKQKTLIKSFDEMLFAGFIDYIEVYKDKKVVIFKDGKKIEI